MKGRARTLWKHAVKEFSGSGLEVVGRKAVFVFSVSYGGPRSVGLRALDEDGEATWEVNEPGMYEFRADAESVWVAGTAGARRVSLETGDIQAERDFRAAGVEMVQVWEPGIYGVMGGGGLMGLDPKDLSTLWEWSDPEGEFVAHGGRLCRAKPGVGLTTVEVPAMRERTVKPEREVPPGLHTHVGDLWCNFDLAGGSGGGRTGVEFRSGKVIWHEDSPAGYGLLRFDADRAYCPLDGLTAYDLRTGKQLWRHAFKGAGVASAEVVQGRVYAASDDGVVHVIDAASGDELLTHKLDYKPSGLGFEPSPVVPLGEDRLVVGTRRAIYCIEVS